MSVKSLYHRFLYRHHMKLIHRWGWHWFSRVGLAGLTDWGGEYVPEHLWCHWCGEKREYLRSIGSERCEG